MDLAIFGDSWAYGAELKDHELNYGQILAQRLDVRVWNHAQQRSSIPHLVEQVRAFVNLGRGAGSEIKLDQTVALFLLTAPARDLLYHEDGTCLHLNPGHPENRWWYSQAHTNHLVSYRVNTSLLALHALCQHHGIKDYYLWGWETCDLWPEIDRTRFVGRAKVTAIDDFFEPWPELSDRISRLGWLIKYRNTNIWPNSNHPNQQGHEKIADLWQDFLTGQGLFVYK